MQEKGNFKDYFSVTNIDQSNDDVSLLRKWIEKLFNILE